MKIAVPVANDNQIVDHYGHCESYNVFTISDNKEIEEIKEIKKDGSSEGCGCKSDISSRLSEDGVKVMLAAGIGEGAVNALNNYGISVIRGLSGDATEVIKLYLNGSVLDKGSSCSKHQAPKELKLNVQYHNHDNGHDHKYGHSCGCN
ncbi:MAG TPA: NifB/NifX family molybdenum-iron cluster-binding protein [Bacteroidales bacterium]|nr:NifB/NifX family molybdenum-iron cluster-binding protein [Bacteroidales bacterium]